MIVLFTLGVLCLISGIYISYRNNKVYLYRNCLINRMRNSPYWKELFMGFSQVSYYKMVFIPKPLKDEYWFSKEFIELLNKK